VIAKKTTYDIISKILYFSGAYCTVFIAFASVHAIWFFIFSNTRAIEHALLTNNPSNEELFDFIIYSYTHGFVLWIFFAASVCCYSTISAVSQAGKIVWGAMMGAYVAWTFFPGEGYVDIENILCGFLDHSEAWIGYTGKTLFSIICSLGYMAAMVFAIPLILAYISRLVLTPR
jgi:hypothetical protein